MNDGQRQVSNHACWNDHLARQSKPLFDDKWNAWRIRSPCAVVSNFKEGNWDHFPLCRSQLITRKYFSAVLAPSIEDFESDMLMIIDWTPLKNAQIEWRFLFVWVWKLVPNSMFCTTMQKRISFTSEIFVKYQQLAFHSEYPIVFRKVDVSRLLLIRLIPAGRGHLPSANILWRCAFHQTLFISFKSKTMKSQRRQQSCLAPTQ